MINYPILDNSLTYSEYINRCRSLIETRRVDLKQNSHAQWIIEANCPFELVPQHPIQTNGRIKYGALLLHGLFDCPFSLRDLGQQLQNHGVLCRSILLPGHGTTPNDLLHVTYHDWIQAVQYGIATLREKVDYIFLVGYSTGAALSVHQALLNTQIAGIVLLAPAIRVKFPVGSIFNWKQIIKLISNKKPWIYREPEVDYTKYLSIPFNPVTQVTNLTDEVDSLLQKHKLSCPIFMAVSHEDEIISSTQAIKFFTMQQNPGSQLLLYAAHHPHYKDPRIIIRPSRYQQLHIKNFSHIAIPFAPQNRHYGQQGDYLYASHINVKDLVYGAYNHIERETMGLFYKLGLTKKRLQELTYNPDFDFMAEQMTKFIIHSS